MCFIITFTYKESFLYKFYRIVPLFMFMSISGTAASLAAVRLESNRPNVMSRVIYIYILLTEREHCIKVFRGFC